MTPHMQHPDWETILAHVDSDGDPAVEAHCSDCPRCAETAVALRGLISNLERACLPELPAGLVDETLAFLQEQFTDVGAAGESRGLGSVLRDWIAGLGDPVRELKATLSADSLSPSAALRGAAAGSPRTLLYEVDDCHVMLQLDEGAQGRLDLRGQFTAAAAGTTPDTARAFVAFEGRVDECGLSEHGGFALTELPAGARELALLVDERLIRIELPG